MKKFISAVKWTFSTEMGFQCVIAFVMLIVMISAMVAYMQQISAKY